MGLLIFIRPQWGLTGLSWEYTRMNQNQIQIQIQIQKNTKFIYQDPTYMLVLLFTTDRMNREQRQIYHARIFSPEEQGAIAERERILRGQIEALRERVRYLELRYRLCRQRYRQKNAELRQAGFTVRGLRRQLRQQPPAPSELMRRQLGEARRRIRDLEAELDQIVLHRRRRMRLNRRI